jgi:muramoyltetrapeptide carboxypeptidase LdcA involved in peptidoglycan recycling
MQLVKPLALHTGDKIGIVAPSMHSNADFGHSGTFMPMPEGILTEMDAEQPSIELVEPVVR